MVTGGVFYTPPALSFPGEFAGDYLFTDGIGGWINRIHDDSGTVTNFASELTGQFPVALAVDPAGDRFAGVWPANEAFFAAATRPSWRRLK